MIAILLSLVVWSGYTDQEVVAITLMGESWGESIEGKRAVGQVILNRKNKRWRGAKSVREVCLDRFQFSSINTMTQEKIERYKKDKINWKRCNEIAEKILKGWRVHKIDYFMFDNRLNKWYKGGGYKKIGNHYFW